MLVYGEGGCQVPQITVYIPKTIDATWRATPQEQRDKITEAIRKLVKRRLAKK